MEGERRLGVKSSSGSRFHQPNRNGHTEKMKRSGGFGGGTCAVLPGAKNHSRLPFILANHRQRATASPSLIPSVLCFILLLEQPRRERRKHFALSRRRETWRRGHGRRL